MRDRQFPKHVEVYFFENIIVREMKIVCICWSKLWEVSLTGTPWVRVWGDIGVL